MYNKVMVLKAISQITSYKYVTVQWYLTRLRRYFGVHKTREIITMLEARGHATPVQIRLSPRGHEVLRLFMKGFTYKQIGENLGMSISGVQRHREKMLWQNNCDSMMQLIAKYHDQENS